MGPEREDRGGWDRREDGSRVRKVKGGGGENGESMDGEEMLGGWRRTSGTGSFISGWLNTGRHSPVSRETISPLPLSAASHPHHLPHFLFLNFSSSISLPHFLFLNFSSSLPLILIIISPHVLHFYLLHSPHFIILILLLDFQ